MFHWPEVPRPGSDHACQIPGEPPNSVTPSKVLPVSSPPFSFFSNLTPTLRGSKIVLWQQNLTKKLNPRNESISKTQTWESHPLLLEPPPELQNRSKCDCPGRAPDNPQGREHADHCQVGHRTFTGLLEDLSMILSWLWQEIAPRAPVLSDQNRLWWALPVPFQ